MLPRHCLQTQGLVATVATVAECYVAPMRAFAEVKLEDKSKMPDL